MKSQLICFFVMFCMFCFAEILGISQYQPQAMQNLFGKSIEESGLEIDKPGSYLLRTDVSYTSTTNPVAITINASHVTIEMDRKSISQDNGLSEGVGIKINDGCHDILFRNGTIADFYDHAIEVGSECSHIMLNNLELVGSTTTITFNGQSEKESYDISISDCIMTQARECALNINYCDNVYIHNCFLIRNKLCTAHLNACNNIKLNNTFFNNTASDYACYAFWAKDSTNILCKKCIFNDTIAQTACYPVLWENVICGNIIECTASCNTSRGDYNCHGFCFKDCEGIILKECQMCNNDTQNGAAGGLLGDGCIGCQVIECVSTANTCTSTTEHATGIHLKNGSRNYIDRCCTNNNVNTADTNKGIGILLDSSERSTVIKSTQAFSNSGVGIKNDSPNAIIFQTLTGGNEYADVEGLYALSFAQTGSLAPQAAYSFDNVQFNL